MEQLTLLILLFRWGLIFLPSITYYGSYNHFFPINLVFLLLISVIDEVQCPHQYIFFLSGSWISYKLSFLHSWHSIYPWASFEWKQMPGIFLLHLKSVLFCQFNLINPKATKFALWYFFSTSFKADLGNNGLMGITFVETTFTPLQSPWIDDCFFV